MRAQPRTVRILLALLALVMAVFPLVGEGLTGARFDYWLQQLTAVMILAILAVSLDLLVGVTGLVSVAHAAFAGIAGYAMVLMAPEFAAANIWIVLPASVGLAALAALVTGALVMRTSGIFFIMATIAFSQMFFYFFHDATFTGGSDGIYIFFKPEVQLFGFELIDLDHRVSFFYVVLGSLLGVYLLLRAMLRAPFGRVLFGIRQNEERVRALGYDTNAYKLAAFVIGGTISGYAGVLAATQYGFVDPSLVSWQQSAHILVMVIMGGMGTLYGPILGAFAFEGLHHWFSTMTRHWELPMGIIVILLVLLLPRGIAGLPQQIPAWWQNLRRGDGSE